MDPLGYNEKKECDYRCLGNNHEHDGVNCFLLKALMEFGGWQQFGDDICYVVICLFMWTAYLGKSIDYSSYNLLLEL